MTITIKGTLKDWGRMNSKITAKTGIVVADDPKFGNILISEAAFRRSDIDPDTVKNGDKIEVEIISHAFRVFQ